MRSRHLTLAVLLVPAWIGCASKADSIPSEDGTGCQTSAAKICDKLENCAPAAFKPQFANRAACESTYQEQCLREVKAPNSGQTGAKYLACAQAAFALSCETLRNGTVPDACITPKGLGADGTACGSDAQCQSAWCRRTSALCGVCGPAPKKGGSCDLDRRCSASEVCETTSCRPIGVLANGSACVSPYDCLSTSCVKGICTALAKTGPCENDGKDKPRCDGYAGFACNARSNTCEPVAFANPGEPCGLDETSFAVVLCAGSNCEVPDGASKGVCKLLPTLGMDCSGDCAGNSYCERGKCVSSDPGLCK